MKKNILLIIVSLVVFGVGYKVVNYIFGEGYRRGFSETCVVDVKVDELSNKKEAEDGDLAPQCLMGDCPEYETFDTNGDDIYESVVVERTAMTQQAGRVWIIDKGKVVFISNQKAQVAVGPRNNKSKEQQSGFIIFYATESPMAGEKIFNDSFKQDYYLFKDGKYVLEKTVDSPIN